MYELNIPMLYSIKKIVGEVGKRVGLLRVRDGKQLDSRHCWELARITWSPPINRPGTLGWREGQLSVLKPSKGNLYRGKNAPCFVISN
jgi:hypothetical protein